MTKYSRYQDYVIKDGNLVGEFEQMYLDYSDPWDQSVREQSSIEKKIGIDLIKANGHKKPLEYGCGLGIFTQMLFENIGNAAGIDISETAVIKARERHRRPKFYVGDLLDQKVLEEYQPDCVCLVEITWYVLEKLESFKNILRTKKGLGFFHSLMTYKEGEQQYGKDYFTSLDEIIEYWSDVIEVTDWGTVGNESYNGGLRTFFYGRIK